MSMLYLTCSIGIYGQLKAVLMINYVLPNYHYQTNSGAANCLNAVYLYYFIKSKCSPSNSITVCCANGGTCVTDGRNCVCPPGYTGRNCAEELCKLS